MHARTGASTRVRTCTLMQAAAPSSSLHTSIVPPSSLTSTSTSARPRRTARRLSSRCDLISSSSSVARCAKAAPRERTHVVSARTSAHAHAHAHAHARTPMRTPTCACTCLAASSAAVCASPDDAELARRSRSSARAPSSDCSVASSLACTSEHTWCETATCPCPCAHETMPMPKPMRACPCVPTCPCCGPCPRAMCVVYLRLGVFALGLLKLLLERRRLELEHLHRARTVQRAQRTGAAKLSAAPHAWGVREHRARAGTPLASTPWHAPPPRYSHPPPPPSPPPAPPASAPPRRRQRASR